MPEPHNPFVAPTPLSMGSNSAHFYDLDARHAGGKPRLHFYHANSYPFPCYREFLSQLEPHFSVFGLALRPTWELTGSPVRRVRWGKYADDLIAFLESRQQGPIIAVGHSIGAVTTMIAAVRRPDLFSRLVLIDPVFLPGMQTALLAMMPWFQQKKMPVVRRALGRPDSWSTPEEFVEFHAGKRSYAGFSPEALQNFADGGLFHDRKNDLYRLAFPKRWEAHIYATAPVMWPTLRRLKTPALGIRGGKSDVLQEGMWQRWQAMHPEHSFAQSDELGHLAPLEEPVLTAQTVMQYLQP